MSLIDTPLPARKTCFRSSCVPSCKWTSTVFSAFRYRAPAPPQPDTRVSSLDVPSDVAFTGYSLYLIRRMKFPVKCYPDQYRTRPAISSTLAGTQERAGAAEAFTVNGMTKVK